MYGSVLGGVAAVLLVAVVARALDVGLAEELRLRVQENGPQAAEAFREWLLPVKTSIQVHCLMHSFSPNTLFDSVLPVQPRS